VYSSTLLPQTTLSAGDLMMVTVNADGDKNFDFVPLMNLEASTVIKFTDAAWDGTALLTNEGTLTYTTSSIVTAGTIVSYSGSAGGNWSSSGSFNPSGTGDNIIVYQVSAGSETFILGIGWARGTSWISSGTVTSNYSFVPPGLSENDNTIVNLSTADNYQYITSNGTSGPKSTLRYLTAQTSNYSGNSSAAYSALTGSFTIGQVINGSSGFRILSSPVSGTIYSSLLGPLWTQGMAGGDVTTGTANVWVYNSSGASWSALSNLTTDSYTAGSGVLVYVFSDVDNDGVDDLPVYLSVPGTENSPTVSVTTTANAWNLLGNPFEATIDADQLFSDNANYNSTVYVWDNAKTGGATYIAWNGSIGDLVNGLIAPYQGFWILSASGGTSFNFTSASKTPTAGTFYKSMIIQSGSVRFSVNSGVYFDDSFLSFSNNGLGDIDCADAFKLIPMTFSERLVCLTYTNGEGLDINNLPFEFESSFLIPLDVMFLTRENDSQYVTHERDVMLEWDLSNLPDHISLSLSDQITGNIVDLSQQEAWMFTTTNKGNFSNEDGLPVSSYPEVGESRFLLSVSYEALISDQESINHPETFLLQSVYPNPFNSGTTISFTIPSVKEPVYLQVYDINGHLVETVMKKILNEGTYHIQWIPKNLPSGLYILQLRTGKLIMNQKLSFIK